MLLHSVVLCRMRELICPHWVGKHCIIASDRKLLGDFTNQAVGKFEEIVVFPNVHHLIDCLCV